jgi:hypothetical protein
LHKLKNKLGQTGPNIIFDLYDFVFSTFFGTSLTRTQPQIDNIQAHEHK